MIDLQPTVNPLDVPLAPASEIVRNWPASRFCRRRTYEVLADGPIRLCSWAILAEVAGYNWISRDAGRLIQDVFGLSLTEQRRLVEVSDWHGKDAAADYLESIGR